MASDLKNTGRIEKEKEEDRPIFQTLFIAGCFYKIAKLKYLKFQIFESTTQFKVQRSSENSSF